MKIGKRIAVIVNLLVGVLLIGMLGFHWIEGWSWFDGFYMALTTMTTIGYGEIHPLSHAGRIFNSVLIVVSVIVVGATIATVSQVLLQFEFGQILGRRRMEHELARLSHHYIICGAGRVGRTVTRELRARGQTCVIVEKDPVRAQWAEKEKVAVIVGNASSEEVLQKARIQTAAGFVAAVSSDAENLYIVLTARGFRPDLKIIARASEEEATPKLLRAGASQVLSPYYFVGHRIVQLFLRPNVLDFIDTAFGTERLDVEIGEVKVPDGSHLAGKTLDDSAIRQQARVVVLAVKSSDGKMRFNPPPETLVQSQDCFIVIGSDSQIKEFETLVAMARVP